MNIEYDENAAKRNKVSLTLNVISLVLLVILACDIYVSRMGQKNALKACLRQNVNLQNILFSAGE